MGGDSRASKKRRKDKEKKRQQKPDECEAVDDSETLNEPTAATAVLENDTSLQISKEDLDGLNVKDLLSVEDSDMDAFTRAGLLLQTFVRSISLKDFYGKYWGKLPLFSEVTDSSAYSAVFSLKDAKGIIESHVNSLGETIEMCKYDDKDKRTKSIADEGELPAKLIWKHFSSGWCIRLLRPYVYDDALWKILSALELEFDATVSCEAYLLPMGSQGFGLRSDNFDAMILQAAGSSRWRLYRPPAGAELPRHGVDDMSCGLVSDAPYTDVTLEPGASLYVPRGWAHQEEACLRPDGKASLHLSVQTNHENSSAEVLELIIPQALEQLIQTQISARTTLPRHVLSYMGVTSSEDDENPLRLAFHSFIQKLLKGSSSSGSGGSSSSSGSGCGDGHRSQGMGLIDAALAMLDPAMDQRAKAFMARRLPVPLSDSEEKRSAALLDGTQHVQLLSHLRMLRPGVARAIVETGMVVVYHCMDNSRELGATPLSPLEFDLDDGPAIEALLKAYPEPVGVLDLPHPRYWYPPCVMREYEYKPSSLLQSVCACLDPIIKPLMIFFLTQTVNPKNSNNQTSDEMDDKLEVARALFKEGFLILCDDATGNIGPDKNVEALQTAKRAGKKDKKGEKVQKRGRSSDDECSDNNEDSEDDVEYADAMYPF
jgi:hypothetical protein